MRKAHFIGIDVGQSGIGFTVVAVDPNSQYIPTAILESIVHIIDGAKDPSTGKSPRSRLAVSGVARRGRRLIRRRAARIRKLARLLAEAGISNGMSDELAVTYEPWLARKRLIDGYIEDDTQRAAYLHLAILHIARHRGWRNPWWSHERLCMADAPTEAFIEQRDKAADYFGVSPDALPTIGSIGALANAPTHPLRPRTGKKSLAVSSGFSILPQRVFQEDQLAELDLILKTQRVDPSIADSIRRAVFDSKMPRVKSGLVGVDPLDRTQLRSPRSALEFQEYRIRSTIGNLRVAKQALSASQRETVIQQLMEWKDSVPPSWDEVASWLGVESPDLSFPSAQDAKSSKAPIMNTVVALKSKKSKLKTVWSWWEQANSLERSQLAAWLGDASEDAESDLIEELIAGLPAEELAVLDGTDGFGTGRAAYSRKTLNRLNVAMQTGDGSLTSALSSEFNVDPGWRPPAESIFDHIDHPVVDQIATVVGRVLAQLQRKYGPPLRVNIEHVREAFLGPEALQEFKNAQTANRNRRERIRIEMRAQEKLTNDGVSNSDIRRYEAIQMQQAKCLYCGAPITFKDSEMDHIVARRIGGSSRRENLVAVCRPCNRRKGKQPFAVWAESDPSADVAEARQRLREWVRPSAMTSLQFNALKRNVSIRLNRKSEDDPLDERALATTAYAAREIAERVAGMYGAPGEVDLASGEVTDGSSAPVVRVFSGMASSEARKASGIDRMLNLRSISQKSRLDRRHHAIDAAVIALLSPKVAKVLAERSELKRIEETASRDSDDRIDRPGSWKEYSGTEFDERALFERWKAHSEALAQLLQEFVVTDQIVVMRPLRLGANVGRLHEDTIRKLATKDGSEAFTRAEIARIVDLQLFIDLQPCLDRDGGLPEIERRPAGTFAAELAGSVELFPGSASAVPTARIAVRGGSAAIGDTLHHSRIFAIRKPDGSMSFKQLRVFAGEFGAIGFTEPGVDLFTAELPLWSQAMRCADPVLLRAIEGGQARQIGWLVAGDELEFPDPRAVPPVLGFDANRWHVPESQERRWVVIGFETNAIVNLKPSYLASEGLEQFEGALPSASTLEIVSGKGWRASPNQVLQFNPSILRRTALGKPRWRDENGMPVSWNVRTAASQVWDDGPVASS